MKKAVLVITALFAMCSNYAQFGQESKDTTWKHVYRAAPERINDLVHTKLAVKFDYDKAWLYGKANITLQPHFLCN